MLNKYLAVSSRYCDTIVVRIIVQRHCSTSPMAIIQIIESREIMTTYQYLRRCQQTVSGLLDNAKSGWYKRVGKGVSHYVEKM